MTPRHVQVADELRARIASGDLARGTQLPSEARLCEHYGASRGTVRTALAALRREGLIGGGRGRAPVVLDSAAAQPFDSLLSFSAWARDAGRRPGQRTIELARRGASDVAAAALGIDPGEHVVDVLRVRLLDDEPVMVERSSFVMDVGRMLFDVDTDSGSIYAHLLGAGVDLSAARHTFDAVAADEADAELLALDRGAPLLRERRIATTADGRPLEYSDDRYRPDRVSFTLANSRPASAGAVRDLRILKELP
jgi:GntR family transcriptional regulator